MIDMTQDEVRTKLAELQGEHRSLDDTIARLIAQPHVDQLELQRLKKRKLMLKDQIAWLERCLIPDIIA